MSKRIAAALAALLLMLAGAATPAAAAPVAPMAWNDCAEGQVCFWEHTNYWGYKVVVQVPFETCVNLPNAGIYSSVRNNRPRSTYMYKGVGCSETAWLLSGDQSYAELSTAPGPAGWDNQPRSVRLDW